MPDFVDEDVYMPAANQEACTGAAASAAAPSSPAPRPPVPRPPASSKPLPPVLQCPPSLPRPLSHRP
eukprot:11462030-Prorocentrum_lima.AAC.1